MTVTATYHAPAGDNEVVHMRGVRFIDGQATELDPVAHKALIGKLRNNPHFAVEGVGDPEPVEAPQGFTTKHKGHGAYSVMVGTESVVDGLSKVEATAFDALSPGDKAEWVQAALDEGTPTPPLVA